jgi:phage FluMu protein Com
MESNMVRYGNKITQEESFARVHRIINRCRICKRVLFVGESGEISIMCKSCKTFNYFSTNDHDIK